MKTLYFKVSTGNFPVSLLYLNIALPVTTKGGNQLLYVTKVDTQVRTVNILRGWKLNRHQACPIYQLCKTVCILDFLLCELITRLMASPVGRFCQL